MKKRVLSILLVLSMLLSTAALASDALGWELHKSVTTLAPGTTVTQQLLWGDSRSDYRREFYLTYTPNASVRPVVAYGANVLSTSTVTALARQLESTSKRVLGGTNGDYFVMSTGAPLGVVLTDGILRSSSSYHYALGFDADGNAVVGKPETKVWVDLAGYHQLLSGGYNKSRTSDGGMTLFSSDFGSTTRAKTSGIDVILRPVNIPEDFVFPALETETVSIDAVTGEVIDPASEETQMGETQTDTTPMDGERSAEDTYSLTRYTPASLEALWQAALTLPAAAAELKIGQSVDCIVTQVIESSAAVNIPEGYFVLSLDASGGSEFHAQLLRQLQKGEKVTLSVTVEDDRFSSAVTAIGAYTLLLKDGVVQDGLPTSADPRTAVGVKADGSVILYALDGRQSGYSVGGSVKQVAQRLKELGCVDAVLFDGGGSTTFGTTDAVGDSFAVTNRPSEGTQRAVTNALFFVSDLTATGVPGSLYVSAADEILLSGAQTTLESQIIDTGYYPTHQTAANVTYSATNGSTLGNVFTAGEEAGQSVITATSVAVGGNGLTTSSITGQTLLTVVTTPHAITVSDQSTSQPVTALSLDPGQTVDLTASATWRNLALKCRDSCFTWSVTPELGTVDAEGRLTVGDRGGSGYVTVTAGEKTVSIPLVVGGHVNALDSCDTLEHFRSDTLEVSLESRSVRYGASALRLDYPEGTSQLELDLPLPAGDDYFGFWLLGDGAEVTVTAQILLTDGTTTQAVVCPQPITGWKQLLLPLPAGTQAVTALTLESAAAGTLYLDHFVSANDVLYDTAPPSASLTLSGDTLTALLSDNVDKTFSADRLTLTRDGKSLAFVLSGNLLSAALPAEDGRLHRYSLTLSDASGNLARVSVSSQASSAAQSPFVDTADHWAEPYAVYLYDQSVVEGSFNAVGRIFEPGKNITRAEFSTMLARWLGLDLEQYAEAALPFADVDSIPAWALNAVKALYSLGIFTGSAEPTGLYAAPDGDLTRAQAMTMLGRVQPKGYKAASEPFADDGDIPLWASEYIYLLTGQGVVSGFGGMVRPNDPITRGEVAKLLTTMW